MSKFFRSGDDSSDSSSDEGLEYFTEAYSDHDSDEGNEGSDDGDEGAQDSDEGVDIPDEHGDYPDEHGDYPDEHGDYPDEHGDYWHFSDSDDSGCDMPRGDRRRYRTQPAPSYGGARLCTGPRDTDTDSESEDERDDGATAGPRAICQWRGSRLMNYIEQNVPAERTPGAEQAGDASEEGWTKVVSRRGWNSSKRLEGKKSG